MVKNPEARGSYSEEYDGEALRELIDMAKLYVAKENGFKGKGSGVPDGSFSDFSCGVWEMLTECVRYGMWLERKKREREDREMEISYLRKHFKELDDADKYLSKLLKDKSEEEANGENWRKPIFE